MEVCKNPLINTFAFLKFGFFMHGTIRLELGVIMFIIYTYRYEAVISFADISRTNSPILMRFIPLIQQVVWSLNTNFQAILII